MLLVVVAGCGGAAQTDAAPAPSPGSLTFAERCAQPGVVKCVGFDSSADFTPGKSGVPGVPGTTSGIFAPYGTTDFSRATQDSAVKASGGSSLRFTIPANSGSDSSGSYFTNFSNDLSVQFDAGQEFFVQWRQRFSPEFLATKFAGGGGWKQVIVGTGDTPDRWFNSCTALELPVQNTYHRGFPIIYNSCTGSASHGPYHAFEEPFGTYDFKLQNARPSPYCLYSQSSTGYFAPNGNCFGYVANEWMTFQMQVKLGPRVNGEFQGSYITLWGAREGRASELLFQWGPYNLTAGSDADNQRYGKIWLLPYNTNKDSSVTNPISYTWYDELIISRTRIADPSTEQAPTH